MTTDDVSTSRGRWFVEFRARLLAAGSFESEEVDSLVAEVEAHCADSGEQPEEAFGTADEYAEGLIQERMPGAQWARRVSDGFTAVDMLVFVSLMVGLHLIVYTVVLVFRGQWTIDLTPAALAEWTTVGLAGLVLGMSAVARNAGRLRLAMLCGFAMAALVVLAATLFLRLPDTVLFRFWSVVPGALGVAIFAVLVPLLGNLGHGRPPAEPDDVDQWFRRLRGLLVGRHEIGRSSARKIVAESRAHLRVRGAVAPEDEFGPVEQYALHVAEHAEHRPPWWRRAKIFFPVMALFLLTIFVVDLARGERGFSVWLSLVAGALLAWRSVVLWRGAGQVQ